MPILRVKEIRDMSSGDRQKRLMELQAELTRLRTMVKAGGSIENPSRIRQLRKAIARILTIENEPEPVQKAGKKQKEKKKKPKKKAKVREKSEEGKKQ